MKISLEPIKDTIGATMSVKTTFTLSPITMGEREFYFPSPLQIDLQLFKQEDVIYVEGMLYLELGLSCSRCLEETTMSLSLPFVQEFSKGEEWVLEDAIDLTNSIEETILLEIPQKPLCSEGCKGLCPYCGQDRNTKECNCQKEMVDPRLALLKNYFFHKKSPGGEEDGRS